MKDFALRLVNNSAVRKAFVALLIALAAAAGISVSSGCGGSLPPAVQRAQDRFDCQLSALELVVPRDVALDLAKAARAGEAEYVVRQLIELGVTPAAVRDAADAFHSCGEPDVAVEPTTTPA